MRVARVVDSQQRIRPGLISIYPILSEIQGEFQCPLRPALESRRRLAVNPFRGAAGDGRATGMRIRDSREVHLPSSKAAATGSK